MLRFSVILYGVVSCILHLDDGSNIFLRNALYDYRVSHRGNYYTAIHFRENLKSQK
jgi:hypothetical protein